jgi:hypothetical protein
MRRREAVGRETTMIILTATAAAVISPSAFSNRSGHTYPMPSPRYPEGAREAAHKREH